jgi:uncharacterized ferredoxin-like protein
MLLLRPANRVAEAMMLLGNKKDAYGCSSCMEAGSAETLDGSDNTESWVGTVQSFRGSLSVASGSATLVALVATVDGVEVVVVSEAVLLAAVPFKCFDKERSSNPESAEHTLVAPGREVLSVNLNVVSLGSSSSAGDM